MMHELGSIFSSLTGLSPSPPRENVTDAHIQGPLKWRDLEHTGTLYAQGHTWWPSPGEKCSVRTEFYPTAEEANVALRRALKAIGYTAPLWWQYWRWNERKNAALPSKGE